MKSMRISTHARGSALWTRARSSALFGVVALTFGLGIVGACQEDLSPQEACRDIPEGGCPAYENACADPSCFATYTCSPNETWQVDQVCPPKEAGPPIEDAGSDAAPVGDDEYVNVPGALGGPGCGDLQTPDCALGVAAACSDQNCCDCQDLYVCANGGWDLWGECSGGVITQNQ